MVGWGGHLRRFPAPKRAEQRLHRWRRDVVLGQAPDALNCVAHLIEVRPAASAATQVLLEPAALGRWLRLLDVLGDKLHDLLAGQLFRSHDTSTLLFTHDPTCRPSDG